MDKALRGLNDPYTGRLLIPAEDLPEWDADPDLYVNIFMRQYYSANKTYPA
jgi:hypothetical protein